MKRTDIIFEEFASLSIKIQYKAIYFRKKYVYGSHREIDQQIRIKSLLRTTSRFFQCHFFKKKLIYDCTGSLLLCIGFLQLWQLGATLQLWCAGFSFQWLPLLRSMDSRVYGFEQLQPVSSVVAANGLQTAGSVVVAHGLSGSVAHGSSQTRY